MPLAVAGLVGLLWSLPVPQVFADVAPVLNWGTLFIMATVVYYFIISIALAVGLLPFVVLLAALIARLDALAIPLWLMSVTSLALYLVIDHAGRAAGGTVILRRIIFVMLGPPRLLAAAYRRLRIPY